MVDVSTANGFTKLLKYIVDPDTEHDEDMQEAWNNLKVGTPIINNLLVEIPSGKQYLISVKPVSGWKV